MDNSVKNEFKEFINTLSTEICKEVLLEDLKRINDSFNNTEKSYQIVCNKYTENITSIKKELSKLEDNNKKIDDFVKTIDSNSKNVNEALNIINGRHQEVITNIIKNNNNVYSQYSKNVQKLNDTERAKFISEMSLSINLHTQNYINYLTEVIDECKFKEIANNMSSLSYKINFLDLQVEDLSKNTLTLEKAILKIFEKNKIDIEKIIVSKHNEVNKQISNTFNEIIKTNDTLVEKISNMDSSINNKNKIIILLLSIMIIMIGYIIYYFQYLK